MPSFVDASCKLSVLGQRFRGLICEDLVSDGRAAN
jgi:hypothetical protein